MTSQVLRQYYPLDVVRDLIKTLPTNHHDQPTLSHILQSADADGWIDVDHRHGINMDFGRRYASHSYQNLTTNTRSLLARDYYHDVDFVNAFPNLFRQVCLRYGLECPRLTYYCEHRELIIADILLSHPIATREFVKEWFIISLHLGNYKHQSTVTIPVLDRFATELRLLARQLIPFQRELFDRATNDSAKKNPMGTFVSWICQIEEQRAVSSLIEFYQLRGLVVGVNMFDGVMGETTPAMTPSFLDEASAYIKSQTTLTIKIIEKPMTPSLSTVVYVVPAIPITRMLVLFDLDGTIAYAAKRRAWTFRPGVAHELKRLKAAGCAVGLFTNKERHNIPLAQLESLSGIVFDAVLANENCYKPTVSYQKTHGMDKYDKCKSLSQYFHSHVNAGNIIIVDDTVSKIVPADRKFLMPITTWTSNIHDVELAALVDRILTERIPKLVSHPFSDAPYLHVYGKDDMRTYEKKDEPGVTCYSIHPIKFDPGVKCVMINAHCGAGKSHASNDWIADADAESLRLGTPRLRMIFISARIQQGHTILSLTEKHGFKLYSDVDDLTNCDRIVIQFESLCRLQNCKPWDRVIVDEVRGVMSQTVSVHTNRHNLQINNTLLAAFIKNSRETLFMDAHIEFDPMVKDFVESLFDKSQLSFHRYTYNPLPRTIIEYSDESTIIQVVVERLRSNKRILIASRGKVQMDAVMKTVKGFVGRTLRTLEFNCDSTDLEMQAFRDINSAMDGIDIIAFTSKITVGADIQVPIDDVFGFYDLKGGSSARDAFQSFFRARHNVSGLIHVLLGKSDAFNGKIKTFDQAKFDIQTNKSIRMEYTAVLASASLELRDGRFQWVTDRTGVTLAHHFAEQHTSFNTSFFRLAVICGFDIEKFVDVLEPVPAVIARLKANHKELKDAEVDRVSAVVAELNALPESEWGLTEIDTRIRRQKATADDILKHRVIPALLKYDLDFRQDILAIEIIATMKHASILHNCKALTTMTEASWMEMDTNSMRFAAIPDIQRLKKPMFDGLHDVCRLVGFGSATDYVTRVHETVFNQHADEVLRITSEICRLDGRRVVSSTSRSDSKAARASFHRELKACGHTLQAVCHVGGSRIDRTYDYHIKLGCSVKVGPDDVDILHLIPFFCNPPVVVPSIEVVPIVPVVPIDPVIPVVVTSKKRRPVVEFVPADEIGRQNKLRRLVGFDSLMVQTVL